MDVLIKFLSDLLGVPYTAVEGSIATLFALVCVFLFRMLWDASRRDNKQVDLEQTLAQLAIRSLNSYDASIQKIEENTQAINNIGELLKSMGTSFGDMTNELKNVVGGIRVLTEHSENAKPILDDIKNSLFKTSKTTIIVEDVDGEVIARFTAEPDDEGNLVVRITERIKQYIKQDCPPSTDDLTEAAQKAVANIKNELKNNDSNMEKSAD